MSAPISISTIFNFYDILDSTLNESDNSFTAQLGRSQCAEVYSDDNEIWQQPGFSSRPSKVDSNSDNAPQAISIARDDVDIIIAIRDTRYQSIYGSLKEGETAVYATGENGEGQPRMLMKQDNSINFYTKKDPSSKAMFFGITPGTDNFTFVNSLGYGIIIDTSGIKLTCKGGTINMTDAGIKIISSGQAQLDGTNIVIGSIGLPPVNSPLCGAAFASSKPSLKVTIE